MTSIQKPGFARRVFLTTLLAISLTIGSSFPAFSNPLSDYTSIAISDGFSAVSSEMSTYLSERLPFMSGLGRNAYRATLPGALAPFPSIMITAGAGLGVMGNFQDIQDASSTVTAIGTGDVSMDALPFVVGPSLYVRAALPWLPVIGGFDFGFKYIQKVSLSTEQIDYENSGFGFDIRYAIMRDIPLIPLLHLSLAAGISYDQLNGKLTTKGAISGGGFTIDGKFGPEWNISTTDLYLQATAKIFILSVTLGGSVGLRGGSTETTLSGTVAGTGTSFDPITVKKDASGTDVKFMAGVGLTFFPFLSLYFEGNMNATTNDIAGSAAVNFVF